MSGSTVGPMRMLRPRLRHPGSWDGYGTHGHRRTRVQRTALRRIRRVGNTVIQSGALNESLLGHLWRFVDGNWLIGEGLVGGPLGSMAKPPTKVSRITCPPVSASE